MKTQTILCMRAPSTRVTHTLFAVALSVVSTQAASESPRHAASEPPTQASSVRYTIDDKWSRKAFGDYCSKQAFIAQGVRDGEHKPDEQVDDLLTELNKVDTSINRNTLQLLFDTMLSWKEEHVKARDKRFDPVLEIASSVSKPCQSSFEVMLYGNAKTGNDKVKKVDLGPFLMTVIKKIGENVRRGTDGFAPLITTPKSQKPACVKEYWLRLCHDKYPDFPIGLITAQVIKLKGNAALRVPANVNVCHMVGIHKTIPYRVYSLLRRYKIVGDELPGTNTFGFLGNQFVPYVRDKIARRNGCKYIFVSPVNGFGKRLQDDFGFKKICPGYTVFLGDDYTKEFTGFDFKDLAAVRTMVLPFCAQLKVKEEDVRVEMNKFSPENQLIHNHFVQAYRQYPRLNGGRYVLALQSQAKTEASGESKPSSES